MQPNRKADGAGALSFDDPGSTIIYGSPRSGTSWLATIFDSHPDTFYLHEPDSILRPDYRFLRQPWDLEAVRAHFDELTRLRHSKCTGSRPVFAKRYRAELARRLRLCAILAIKSSERLLPAAARLPVPDLGDIGRARLVVKSVGVGLAGAWSAAAPRARHVVIVRHPCGHVFSVQRGSASGELQDSVPLGFAETAVAERYGIAVETLRAMPYEQVLAWRWAILNEMAMDEAAGARVIRYEDLCESPRAVAQDLFTLAGLEWHPQVDAFLGDSTGKDGGYFEKSRIPLEAANRWRTAFAAREDVWQTIKHTRPAQLFAG